MSDESVADEVAADSPTTVASVPAPATPPVAVSPTPAPAEASSSIEPHGASAPGVAELRRPQVDRVRRVGSAVLGRLRKRATDVVLEPQSSEPQLPMMPPVVVTSPERPAPLLRSSPFSFGFFAAAGALLAVWLFQNLGNLSNIIMIVVVSLFLALGLNPIVEALTGRLRLRRWVSVSIVALGAIGVVVAGSWALVPLVAEQVTLLVKNAPALVGKLRQNETLARWDAKWQLIEKLNEAVGKADWTGMFGGVLGAGALVANTLMSLVIGLVLTLYFLAELPQIKSVIYNLSPRSSRPRAQYLANEMFRRIGGYLSGMFVVMLSSAVCSFVMMQFVGLSKYSLALAFIAGLGSGIPLIGPPVAMCLVALVALTVSPTTAAIVVVYFLIYQQFEAYVLSPRIMQKSVNVPGPVVVVAAVAGGSLLGIVGALIAVPTAAALLLLYREVLLPALDRS